VHRDFVAEIDLEKTKRRLELDLEEEIGIQAESRRLDIQDVIGENKEMFDCPICMDIVHYPIECSVCNRIMCESCSLKFIKPECPFCDSKWTKNGVKRRQKLNRYMKNNLDETRFKCKDC
jgi:hypothetical protein